MTLGKEEKRLTNHIAFCVFLMLLGYLFNSNIPVAIAAWLLFLSLLSLFDNESKPPQDPPSIPPTGKTSIQGA